MPDYQITMPKKELPVILPDTHSSYLHSVEQLCLDTQSSELHMLILIEMTDSQTSQGPLNRWAADVPSQRVFNSYLISFGMQVPHVRGSHMRRSSHAGCQLGTQGYKSRHNKWAKKSAEPKLNRFLITSIVVSIDTLPCQRHGNVTFLASLIPRPT